jgi:hypothetical protein
MSGHVLNLSLNLDRIGPEIPKNRFFFAIATSKQIANSETWKYKSKTTYFAIVEPLISHSMQRFHGEIKSHLTTLCED